MDTPNPMFAKFDQVLGKTTTTTNVPQVSTRASEIRKLATQSTPAKPGIVGGVVGDLVNPIKDIVQKRGDAFYGDITGTSAESKGEDNMTRGIQAFGQASAAVPDVVGAVISHLIPQGVKDRFAEQTDEGKDNPLRKGLSSAFADIYDKVGVGLNDLISKHPTLGKELETALKKSEALGNVSNMVLTGEGVAKTAQGVVNTGKKVVNTVQDTATNLGNKANQYAEKSLKSDWSKPTEVSKAGFKKPTEIYKNAADQGHDISDTLVKNKISLADNVQDGKYSTLDTAENLRSDAGKMSKDILRPSLEKADAVVPRTPTQDVVEGAIKNINENKYITQETKDSLIEKLNSTKGALEKRFPDGMSLTDMHDEKIVRDLNAKYSPIGDIATNAEASKNKAIADSLRVLVEDKAPVEIPVKEFNAELAKQFQAADYLESLNTKTVPKSIASRIAKTTAKVVGATVGHGIGGGVLGGVGGYHIGGMLEGMLEGLPNPLKTSFLRNLETTNPEAFAKVQDYLVNLDQSGSVAQPMSNMSKNINIPKSVTQAEEKVKDFVKNPKIGLSVENVTKNISSGEKGTLRDFTDYVNGSYKPSAKEIKILKADVQDIAKKYGFSKSFDSDKALAKQIGEYLDSIGYDKKIK